VRVLTGLDYGILAGYLAAVFGLGLLLMRRAGRSVEDFFVGGRQMPWWLLGVSMAATNFSIDTPIAITELIAAEGMAGIWFTWGNAISALLVTFLFARLWQRSRVLTDAELVEVRYGGRGAAALRLVKGLYFGLIFNAFILGWVFLALTKVMGELVDIDTTWMLVGTVTLVFIYSVASGFYGVVLTDFLQYFVALAGSLLLAGYAVAEVGGIDALVARVGERIGPQALHLVPDVSVDAPGPLSLFLTYILIQWWAHKYADGGGKHIQRMLSARSEGDAFGASLLYSLLNYALQIWPWVLTALCALALFGRLEDPGTGYAKVMVEVLPPGIMGLVLAGLAGAFMSTVDTHLNLGAAYIVNDLYRRFLVRDADERHYVRVSRLAMAGLLIVSILLALQMSSVAGAWKFLLTFASGAGLTWILRWFWWRINAWSELSAMLTSGVVATTIELTHGEWLFSAKLGLTVAISTVVWITVTLLTPPTDPQTLASFVRRVRPGVAGWRPVLATMEEPPAEPLLGPALRRWALALLGFFGFNFTVGNLILGRPLWALGWASVAVAAGVALIVEIRRRRSAHAAV